jgi:hypothetical protein
MARRKSNRRRGRPRQDRARRRETTRAGRRGEPALIDHGTAEALRHRVELTGLCDLPADPLGTLLGRGLINKSEYAAGRSIEELLAIAHGLGGGSVQAAWLRIVGGCAGGLGIDPSAAAERAWRVLARLRRRIGSEELADLVFEICDGRWPAVVTRLIAGLPSSVDRTLLAGLAAGLDRVARSWSSGRGLTKTA